MSKLTDALELAKAGFKAKEIKEMLEEQNHEPDPKPAEEKTQPEEKADPPAGDPQPDPAAGNEKDPPAGDPEPDSKYKELEDKYNDLLRKYQQNNVRQDISDKNEKPIEEQARDILAEMIGG